MGIKIFFFILIIFIKFTYSQINSDSLALKLLEVTKSKEAYENIIALMIVEHSSLYGNNSELLSKFIWKHFNYDSIKSNYVSLYTEEFTASDLKKLIDFYNTEIGKKVISKTPIMVAKSLRFANETYHQKLPILDSLLSEEYLTFLRDTSTVFINQPDPPNFLDETDFEILSIDSLNSDDCVKFKEGKFVIKNDTTDYFILRDQTSQHEIMNFLNYDDEYKIEWLSNCEYNLTFIKNKNKKLAIYKSGDLINIKIIDIRENEYDCIINFNNKKIKKTVVKVL